MSIWNSFDGRLFFVHIYINVHIGIENFQLKEVLLTPFAKTMVMWQTIACYKCTSNDYDIILININFTA
jgi:hypothetical protein